MVSPKRRWRSSERIALSFLEELGYKVIETRKKVKVEGIEIAEIDAVVEDSKGEKYAVEIKAGRIDVTGIRQAYVNAVVAGLKPLVIAKGFADDSAAVLADKLGVKVIQLSDYFLVETEELELLIRSSIEEILLETLAMFIQPRTLSPEDKRIIKEIASNPTIYDAAESLGMDVRNIVRKIKQLQNKGILPQKIKGYNRIRLYASMLLLKQKLEELTTMIRSVVVSEESNE